MRMAKISGGLSVLALGALLLSGCVASEQPAADAADPTVSPVDAGRTLRGVPVEPFTCDALLPDRPMKPLVAIDPATVTGLVVCGSELPPTGVAVSDDDPGFEKVLTALAAKDVSLPGSCPATHGRTWSLSFLASSSGQAYIVRVPRGGCSGIQLELSQAVAAIGIHLSHYPHSG
jgi:hypothetical protein